MNIQTLLGTLTPEQRRKLDTMMQETTISEKVVWNDKDTFTIKRRWSDGVVASQECSVLAEYPDGSADVQCRVNANGDNSVYTQRFGFLPPNRPTSSKRHWTNISK